MLPNEESLLEGSGVDATVLYAGGPCGRSAAVRDHPGGCLHLLRTGRAELVVPGRQAVPIEEPSLIFFANGSPHAVRALDEHGFEMVCAVVGYDATFARSVELSFPEHVVIPLMHFTAIAHLLEAFFQEALSRTTGSRALADRLGGLALTYVCRHVMQGHMASPGLIAAARDRRIAAALSLIHERYEEDLSLQDLSAAAGMSRARFAASFNRLVGRSPHQYLVEYRIGVARRLLLSGLPVKVVASRVGYCTVPAFVRKFKDLSGATPGAWQDGAFRASDRDV